MIPMRKSVVETIGTVHSASRSATVEPVCSEAAGRMIASANETEPRMPAKSITNCILGVIFRLLPRKQFAIVETRPTMMARARKTIGKERSKKGRSHVCGHVAVPSTATMM